MKYKTIDSTKILSKTEASSGMTDTILALIVFKNLNILSVNPDKKVIKLLYQNKRVLIYDT